MVLRGSSVRTIAIATAPTTATLAVRNSPLPTRAGGHLNASSVTEVLQQSMGSAPVGFSSRVRMTLAHIHRSIDHSTHSATQQSPAGMLLVDLQRCSHHSAISIVGIPQLNDPNVSLPINNRPLLEASNLPRVGQVRIARWCRPRVRQGHEVLLERAALLSYRGAGASR